MRADREVRGLGGNWPLRDRWRMPGKAQIGRVRQNISGVNLEVRGSSTGVTVRPRPWSPSPGDRPRLAPAPPHFISLWKRVAKVKSGVGEGNGGGRRVGNFLTNRFVDTLVFRVARGFKPSVTWLCEAFLKSWNEKFTSPKNVYYPVCIFVLKNNNKLKEFPVCIFVLRNHYIHSVKCHVTLSF